MQKHIIDDIIEARTYKLYEDRNVKRLTKEKAMQENLKDTRLSPMNNIEEYQLEKEAREKRLLAYVDEIQQSTLQMSSELIAELVAERKHQKKTQQDIADITGVLPANIARFENGSRVPTLVMLQKYADALGKKIKIEICDPETM